MKNSNYSKKDKALVSYAIKLNGEEKYNDALKILLELESNYKNDSVLNGLIATTYTYLNDKQNSIIYFMKTTNLNPKSELASLGLFHALWDICEYEKAFIEMDRFLKNNEPKNYKITLEELLEQLDEETPRSQKIIIEKYYKKYIKSPLAGPDI